MSLESWKQLYYPVTAKEAATFHPIDVILHSLTKWRGLRPAVLAEYDIEISPLRLLDNTFQITGLTCSLCAKYYDYSVDDEVIACSSCPLAQLGVSKTDCYVEYRHWRHSLDPEPMIALLEKALQTAEGN